MSLGREAELRLGEELVSAISKTSGARIDFSTTRVALSVM